MTVSASCTLSEECLKSVLNTNPDQLMSVFARFRSSGLRTGIQHNINNINILTAVFAATGQDIACAKESSSGVLMWEYTPSRDGVSVTLHLPTLVIGTVGGGTQLPDQRACLDIMGCAGSGKVRKLAEIIAGYCIALDISLLAAIGSGEFSDAHNRLGRNRPSSKL